MVRGVWYVVGMIVPVLVYKLHGYFGYLKTKFSQNPDYISYPKYERLVWKCHRLLMHLLPYYQLLDRKSKKLFISRLIHVIPQKTFVGREGETITLEKQIVVVSTLIQLTFGLPKFALPKFGYIALYPSAFYSKLLNTQVKGLTFGSGVMLLSWLDTFKGIRYAHDNLSLALHEWAHAFIIDHYNDDARWFYFTINKQSSKVIKMFKTMKKQENANHYLRPYAMTNKHEFFAVCVEHFFESPQEFRKELPELFHTMCTLLNQNPLHTDNPRKLGI